MLSKTLSYVSLQSFSQNTDINSPFDRTNLASLMMVCCLTRFLRFLRSSVLIIFWIFPIVDSKSFICSALFKYVCDRVNVSMLSLAFDANIFSKVSRSIIIASFRSDDRYRNHNLKTMFWHFYACVTQRNPQNEVSSRDRLQIVQFEVVVKTLKYGERNIQFK